MYRGVFFDVSVYESDGFWVGGVYPSFLMMGMRLVLIHLMQVSRDFLSVMMVRSFLFSLYLTSWTNG